MKLNLSFLEFINGPRYQNVTMAEYVEFAAKYIDDLQRGGQYAELRLGQAFVYHFNIKHDPELFYETNIDKIGIIIAYRYLQLSLQALAQLESGETITPKQ